MIISGNAPMSIYGECALHVVTSVKPRSDLALGAVRLTVGGPAAVVSLQLARLGHRSRLVGICGDDDPGTFVRTQLERQGVDCRHLAAVGRTATVVAVVGEGDLALAADPGASWSASPWREHPPQADGGFGYVTGFPEFVPTIRSLGEQGCRLVVDIGFKPLLAEPERLLAHAASIADVTDVCVVSGAELDGTVREALAESCIARGTRVLLTTLAENGVLVTTEDGTTHLPAYPVLAVDSLCAGDSFIAGFLCATMEGLGLLDAVRFAQAVAAIKVSSFGRLAERNAVDALVWSEVNAG